MPASNSRTRRCTFQHAPARARTPPLISARRAEIKGGVLARVGNGADAVLLFGLARARNVALMESVAICKRRGQLGINYGILGSLMGSCPFLPVDVAVQL